MRREQTVPTKATPKPVKFVGASKDDLSSFSKDAKLEIGHALNEAAHGLSLNDIEGVKPFASVGPGVYQVSTRTGVQGQDHRAFFIVKHVEAVYVLHAFEKKTQRTPAREIELGQKRLAQLAKLRQQLKQGTR